MPEAPIRIGISSCLLGQNVRFDGGHKRDRYLTDLLGAHVEWVSICPEVEMGLGTPRASLRLESQRGEVRLVQPATGADHTEAMRRWAAHKLSALVQVDLSGYVLKKDSPSCGMERVRLYQGAGAPSRHGRGIFAAALLERFPHLPVEEEGRLNDPRLRENFIERVFAYRRLTAFFAGHWTLGGLVAFHTAEKLLLMAHSPEAYRRLGRWVAGAKGRARQEVKQGYQRELMAALAVIATPRRQVNVLQHMLGHFSQALSAEDRRELVGLIEEHGRERVPLIVPLTLLRHHLRRLKVTYLLGQTYLDPHPRELMLRNHV